MPDYDAGFKIVAQTSGRQLAQVAGVACGQWEQLSGEVQATERLADRAFRGRRGRQRFVVYMEAYTRWEPGVPWSVLAKAGLLSERERLPTRSLVYVLLPKGYHAQGCTFRLTVDGEPTQQVWFREVCLWQVAPEPWWEEAPGLMALYPLCRHDRAPAEAVAHAAQAIGRHVDDAVRRATLLTTLAIFGRLKMPQPQVLDIIGRKQMIESPLYDEIMEEGRIETKRFDIQQALVARFGAEAAAEFRAPLEGIGKLKKLSALFDIALTAGLPEFRKALAKAHGK